MRTRLRDRAAVTAGVRPADHALAAGTSGRDLARVGLVAAVVLMVAAMVVPAVTGWDIHEGSFPPLAASWRPRIGWGLPAAVIIAIAAAARGFALASSLSWRRLLAVAFTASLAWMIALATVDGWTGIGGILGAPHEYLKTARGVTDISTTLHEYIERIPFAHPHNWSIQLAGHPPGALLFFVLLVHIGLGGGLAAGLVVIVLAASTPVAVLVTLRRLGAEDAARLIAPILVIGPFAVWSAVSADAMFAAAAAWGLCLLACAATAPSSRRTAGWGVGAGLLLGYCALLSYGLVLLGVLALGVLVVARTARPLPWVVVAYAAVVLTFAWAGFAWWDAYPVLRERYWDGAAAIRPTGYWLWANLALLCFSAGPVVGAVVAVALRRVRSALGSARVVAVLAVAGLGCVLLADLSLMSKAEVERIWLPFVPWLLVGAALLPVLWLRRAFVAQIALALAVQTLVFTHW